MTQLYTPRFTRARRLAESGALVAVFTTFAACGGSPQQVERPAPVAERDTGVLSAAAVRLARFTIEPATSTQWKETWSVPARLALDPNTTHLLGAIAEGRVTRAFVRVGDRVRAGQVLVALHSHEMMAARSDLAKAQAADAEAESALRLAASSSERAERLYALKALSLADLERARTAHTQAEAARAQARAELARAGAMREHLSGSGPAPSGIDEHEVLIRSPINGVVVSREAQPGSVVLVGAPLVTVSPASDLVLVMRLPERALGAAQVGSTVRFTVAAFPGEHFDARVTRLAPTLDSLTRTIEAQAQVLTGADRLRAEMYANAEIIGAPGGPAITVPAAAVQAMEGDTVVITGQPLGEGMQIEALRVRVGRRTSEVAEIITGLNEGAPVITDGAAIAKAELLRRRGEQ
jgi:cobalt-zinc-cadmium efflux system membrane fusion protein